MRLEMVLMLRCDGLGMLGDWNQTAMVAWLGSGTGVLGFSAMSWTGTGFGLGHRIRW